jgi:hypothetical protein
MSRLEDEIIGHHAPAFIEFLVHKLSQIQMITLFRPPFSKPIQQDLLLSATERDLIARGLAFREKLGLPFWDSVLLCTANQGISSRALLKRVSHHNAQDLDSLQIYRSECSEIRLREIIEDLPIDRMLALSSRVLTKRGEVLHLPMLDFHCPVSPEHETLVKSVITELGLKGYVAKSGGSYHFYGRTLVPEQALIDILAKSLLFCPIIDRAWIAHQLIERACGLRISPGKSYENSPEIITIIR